nr:GNAT family N-acetyltransferase [Pelagibaculum spongiae]
MNCVLTLEYLKSNTLIGYIELEHSPNFPVGKLSLFIRYMYVFRSLRGQGLSRILLAATINISRQEQYPNITAKSTGQLEEYYEKIGFYKEVEIHILALDHGLKPQNYRSLFIKYPQIAGIHCENTPTKKIAKD